MDQYATVLQNLMNSILPMADSHTALWTKEQNDKWIGNIKKEIHKDSQRFNHKGNGDRCPALGIWVALPGGAPNFFKLGQTVHQAVLNATQTPNLKNVIKCLGS
jgi:hypothetical protein